MYVRADLVPQDVQEPQRTAISIPGRQGVCRDRLAALPLPEDCLAGGSMTFYNAIAFKVC